MIYYADDDADDRLIVQEIADDLNLELVTFESGLDMLCYLRDAPALPKIILLDIKIPIFSGHDITEILRQNPVWDGVPIIMITTATVVLQINRAFEAGANFYVTKDGDYKRYKRALKFVSDHYRDFTLVNRNAFVYSNSLI